MFAPKIARPATTQAQTRTGNWVRQQPALSEHRAAPVAGAVRKQPGVGAPDEPLEMEADRVADRVMRMPGSGMVERKDGRRRPAQGVTARKTAPDLGNIPSSAREGIRAPGRPLDTSTLRFFETRFGHDLSHVRVHADHRAAASARSVGAHAYTIGSDIAFAEGRYDLTSAAGKLLLAHEIAHIVQQRHAPYGPAFQKKEDGQARLSAIQGLPMRSLLDKLSELSPEITSDEDTGRRVGGPRLVVAMRAVVAKRDHGLVDFLAINRAGIQSLPADQAVDIMAFIGAPQLTDAPQQGPADATPSMSGPQRVIEAYHRAKLAPAFRAKLESLVSPEALVGMIIGFAATFVIAQFTPVGWAADIGFALTALFVGTSVLAVAKHLVAFAGAANAKTSAELDAAGAEFAAACAEGSIDLVIALVTHKLAGGKGGQAGPEGPSLTQVSQVRIGVQNGQLVMVAAQTIPADVAAALGTKTALITGPLLAVAGGPGSPKPPTSSSGSPGVQGARTGAGPGGARAAEESYIAKLKRRYPKLAPLDIRPRQRPTGSSYIGPAEDLTAEVGGKPQYRTKVTGAPESAFEERMRTSQGRFSLSIIDDGTAMELDGISVDGWLENVKIEQKIDKLDDIVARLRVEADWAANYGLKGVHFSIAPPKVADAVEAALADQGVRNVYRVE